jgi:glutamate synthase (NADPH/NADH) small chain
MPAEPRRSANPLKPPARVKIPRQHPMEQEALRRGGNFEEVSSGFDAVRARQEALRCLDCTDPSCVEGCPVNVDIPGFIACLIEGDVAGAAERIRASNSLPAVCGRVCPQETQCEAVCKLGKKFEPVAIGQLERFVADQEAAQGLFEPRRLREPNGRKVAVVGSGPAGLTCAAELARLGYSVTVFEALHAAGGVLRYGIPEFRLPKRILDEELDRVRALGVDIQTDVLVGRTLEVDELLDGMGYEAVFLGTGAGTPTFLGIPGESLNGVYSANEFLTRVNLMGAWRFPEQDTPVNCGRAVAVVGGGNTALDAVRTARRLGAERAYLVYRRSRREMPARQEEVRHAEEEGIDVRFLTNPVRVVGDAEGRVVGLECQRMELGAPGADGRARPVAVAGSEFVLDVGTVIEAIGQSPNPIVQRTTPGLDVGPRGTVTVGEGQATSRPRVFAGGDLSRGGATVILAMQDGRRAAAAIDAHLTPRD